MSTFRNWVVEDGDDITNIEPLGIEYRKYWFLFRYGGNRPIDVALTKILFRVGSVRSIHGTWWIHFCFARRRYDNSSPLMGNGLLLLFCLYQIERVQTLIARVLLQRPSSLHFSLWDRLWHPE
jgi:hypothetical protein